MAGLVDDQLDAHHRREVVHDVALVDELAHHRGREHGLDDEMKVGALAQMRDVLVRSGRDVVEGEDLPALVEQELRKV